MACHVEKDKDSWLYLIGHDWHEPGLHAALQLLFQLKLLQLQFLHLSQCCV